jgi:sugar O-acyltransferase (sialic acid O-acetyltransferase NeuD family)
VNKQPLVIFGAGDIARLAAYYFSEDSAYDVVAFTVDTPWLQADSCDGKPVVPFETLATHYPPERHELFIALSYSGLNRLRREKYLAAKAQGYRLASYVSSRATVLNQYQHGDNCFILEDNTIQPFVHIGNNVTLWSGNHIGHHSIIDDHCFLASHIVVSGGVHIGPSCFIGVNATLRDHICIGAECLIGAGALMLADVEPQGVYMATATDRSRVPSSRIKRI